MNNNQSENIKEDKKPEKIGKLSVSGNENDIKAKMIDNNNNIIICKNNSKNKSHTGSSEKSNDSYISDIDQIKNNIKSDDSSIKDKAVEVKNNYDNNNDYDGEALQYRKINPLNRSNKSNSSTFHVHKNSLISRELSTDNKVALDQLSNRNSDSDSNNSNEEEEESAYSKNEENQDDSNKNQIVFPEYKNKIHNQHFIYNDGKPVAVNKHGIDRTNTDKKSKNIKNNYSKNMDFNDNNSFSNNNSNSNEQNANHNMIKNNGSNISNTSNISNIHNYNINQYIYNINTINTHNKQPLYKLWKGNNYFCCEGSVILG